MTSRDTVATEAVRAVSDPRIVSNGRPADDGPDVEVEDPRDGDEALDPQVRYSIFSYGADFSVDGYLTRLRRRDIFIPDFQRNFVWTIPQASRFIESLILDLPVPGVFLFREPDTRKLMVVDGQQRLRSLEMFKEGVANGREFRLTGVSAELEGCTWDHLLATDRRSLEDAIIHATIFQQNDPADDCSSVYEVFERLNSGGTALQDQEVRACVYRGSFVRFLGEMNQDVNWRALFGKTNRRKKDEEIILRFLALYESLSDYRRPMKHFLNRFAARHRTLAHEDSERFRRVFENTMRVVNEVLTPRSLRPRRAFNVAVADAVLVGVARRLDKGPLEDPAGLKQAHREVMEQLEERQLYQGSTTHQDRLIERVRIAVETYASVR